MEYLPTIIVAAIIAVIFVAIVVTGIRNKMKGKSSCSCGCDSCGMGCHEKAKTKK
ncbi:MAG: FeoB-associated Cys-rich membrane protein [Clostridia bacterium]|nr:FeoB-associated Cys-rich membrane protein [Clostridia bacterium]